VAAVVVYPVDVVKTRMQSQTGGGSRGRPGGGPSALECLSDILKTDGIGGLYRGLLAQLIGVWPDKAAKMSAYDFMVSALSGSLGGPSSAATQAAAGLLSGVFQVVFSNPREVLKIQMQLGGPAPPPAGGPRVSADAIGPRRLAVLAATVEDTARGESELAALARTVARLGPRALYCGVPVCAARDMSFGAVYFPLYSALKDWMASHGHHGALWLAICGTLAGIPATVATNPIDVVKTRVQAEAGAGPENSRAVREHIAALLEEGGGPRALMRGLAPRVLRMAPQFGVTQVVYELVNGVLGW